MPINLRDVTDDDILRLDVDERRMLISRIEQTVGPEDAPPLTPEQEAYLDELLAEYDANPDEGRPWREVMDEIRGRWLKP